MVETMNDWFYTSLTRQEKEACTAYGLNWREWVHLEHKDRYRVVIGNINTGEKKTINRYAKVKKGEKKSWQQ